MDHTGTHSHSQEYTSQHGKAHQKIAPYTIPRTGEPIYFILTFG